MTIPGAVQLVLQAGAMGEGSDTYVLRVRAGEGVDVACLERGLRLLAEAAERVVCDHMFAYNRGGGIGLRLEVHKG